MFFWGNEEQEEQIDYVKSLQTIRQEKDIAFKMEDSSPIEDKKTFDGLRYFFPDENFKVQARFEPVTDSVKITIMRNDGASDTYLKFGKAVFELNNREHKVLLLKNLSPSGKNHLFLPFSDLTAGRETYPGGRYLDLKMPKDGKIELDFNLAYNPYCVYNYRYSCPLPPKENFIETEIKAGEKLYQD